MARYIDADAFKAIINEHCKTQSDKEQAYWFGVLIDIQPTANVAPIADTVRMMQERLRFEIINKPSEFLASQASFDFLNGMTHRQHEILDILDQIAKEMLEGDNEN